MPKYIDLLIKNKDINLLLKERNRLDKLIFKHNQNLIINFWDKKKEEKIKDNIKHEEVRLLKINDFLFSNFK